MEEIGLKSDANGDLTRDDKGKFVKGNPGGPGRPDGLKNKATMFKEALLDAFNNRPGRVEAFERTLFEVKDGQDYVNLEALRAIVNILPPIKSDGDSSQGQITIVINNGQKPIETVDVEVSNG